MHEYASERRQQAERIRGLGTTFGMREVGRKPVGAEYVSQYRLPFTRRPVSSAWATLWRGDECAANRVDWRLQAGGGHPYGALEGAR